MFLRFPQTAESGYPKFQLPYRLHSLPLTCMRSSIEVASIAALGFLAFTPGIAKQHSGADTEICDWRAYIGAKFRLNQLGLPARDVRLAASLAESLAVRSSSDA